MHEVFVAGILTAFQATWEITSKNTAVKNICFIVRCVSRLCQPNSGVRNTG